MSKLRVTYFFRTSLAKRFSIESLFSGLMKWIGARHYIESVEMPVRTTGFKSIWKNGRFAKQNQEIINHVTGDVNYVLLFFSKRNLNILTIHDTGLLGHSPKGSMRYTIFKKLWFDWPMSRADFVTTISAKTRKQLLEMKNTNANKIRLIPNFVDPDYTHTPKEFNESRPVILFIGTAPHKNLSRLIRAIIGLTVKLDIVGVLSSEFKIELEQNNIDYNQSEGLSKEALIEKYIECDLVAFPSLHEGFGMPILEAQAIGRCILTSDISPTKEVAGDGAVLVDPHRVDSIREGLLKIFEDKRLRSSILEKGRTNVQKYQLEEIGKMYESLYLEGIKNKRRN